MILHSPTDKPLITQNIPTTPLECEAQIWAGLCYSESEIERDTLRWKVLWNEGRTRKHRRFQGTTNPLVLGSPDQGYLTFRIIWRHGKGPRHKSSLIKLNEPETYSSYSYP